MADNRPLSLLVDAAGLKSTDDVLKAASVALKGDRKKLRKLVLDARGRLGKQAKDRVNQQLRKTREQLLGTQTKNQKAKARAKEAPALAIRGAKLSPTQSLQKTLRMQTRLGRRVPLRRGPVQRGELLRLVRAIEANTRGLADAVRHNARSIDALAIRQDKLAATQRETAKLVAELQSRGDVPLMQGLLSSVGKLDIGISRCKKAISIERRKGQNVQAKVGNIQKDLREMTGLARVQKVNDAVTAMQTAAFGAKGNMFDPRNLRIAGNHTFWSLLPDILKGLGISWPAGNDLVQWLRPAVTLATAQALSGNQQNERFVSGIAEGTEFVLIPFAEEGNATISLQPYIGSSFWDEFRTLTNVPVTTNLIAPPAPSLNATTDLSGTVNAGVLTINARWFGTFGEFEPTPAQIAPMRVAWMVDTGQG